LVAINAASAEFFTRGLQSAEAAIGRTFLDERGFDAAAAKDFGVGYAPKSWSAVVDHLRARGFRDDELLAAGIVAQGQRGVYDRFRGRLVWPIRDLGGDVLGFGARRLFDDDQGPKYLNTPETPLYKKSSVLYGIDLARKEIAKQQRVVVVEGYTDVMACVLSGVPTAVATCGTSFGDGHVKVLRRILMDDSAMRGEVIFTFDGDAAGRRAAMRAFETDQSFVAQTFVAVERDGLDPCDLRLRSGPEAVAALVDSRMPMFEFAIRSTLDEHNLSTAEGRVAGLRATAPMLGSMRDPALFDAYARQLAGWLGVPPASVLAEIGGRGRSAGGRSGGGRADAGRADEGRRSGGQTRGRGGGPADAGLRSEQQALQVMLQRPDLVAEWIESTEETAFTDPAARAVFEVVREVGPPVAADESALRNWSAQVIERAPTDEVRADIRMWSVKPLPLTPRTDPETYATGVMARLHSMDVARRIAPLKGQLARMNPAADQVEFAALMTQVMDLEAYRRELQAMSTGEM
jgi:DNA primase